MQRLRFGAYAQAISGNLVGTVIDSSSAVVANASVEATKIDTGVITTTSTGNTGAYRFENLPVGTYRIVVKSSGFKTSIQQVDVVLNQTGTLNFTLALGATSETIEVSGVAATIDTTSAQLQTTYDSRFSQDLGISSAGGTGAGVLNLSLLSPGVTQSSSLGIGVGPSVGGQRPYNNNFTVEGVDNNNKAVTGNLITVPNDAVENFTLAGEPVRHRVWSLLRRSVQHDHQERDQRFPRFAVRILQESQPECGGQCVRAPGPHFQPAF